MGGLCCTSIRGHSTFAYQLSLTISGAMKDNHFSSINPFVINAWRPRLQDFHIQSIGTYIAKATRRNSIPVDSIAGFANDYIAYQIACYLSKCILSHQVDKFTILDIPIDEVFVNRSSFKLDDDVFEIFKREISKMSNGSTADLATADPTVKHMLSMKFDEIAAEVINRIEFNDIFMTCYREYTRKREEHLKNIADARKSSMENAGIIGIIRVTPEPESNTNHTN